MLQDMSARQILQLKLWLRMSLVARAAIGELAHRGAVMRSRAGLLTTKHSGKAVPLGHSGHTIQPQIADKTFTRGGHHLIVLVRAPTNTHQPPEARVQPTRASSLATLPATYPVGLVAGRSPTA